MRPKHTLLAALLLSATALAQSPLPASLQKATAAVSSDRIREQDKFISDDLFEGRYPGLRGGELAAKYIASQFALMGLVPAGDNGTFLQQVAFVGMKAIPAETHFTLYRSGNGAAFVECSGPHAYSTCGDGSVSSMLRFGDDYTASNQTLTPTSTFDAPIVFVGYGATAPEFHWNDYANIDVKGKVILCIVGDPPSDDPKFFGGAALTYYGRWIYKFEQAARMGAVGALIIHRTDLASYGWDVVQNSFTAEISYLRDDANPRLQAASWIQLETARKIFAMSHLDLDKEIAAAGKPGFQAIELPVRLKSTITSTVRPFESPNVVAMLRGTSRKPDMTKCTGTVAKTVYDSTARFCPFSPDQAVLYTAHYDHLGFVPNMPGDNVFNGAADNGTGVAMLLEMAHAWTDAAHNGLSLPHSVLFASVTAEEQGLLGSKYLGQHPPIPANQIALDINFDMLLPFGVQKEVNVNGAQRTTFFPQVQAIAQRFGLTIVPDPRPSAGTYYRSDHFSLSRVGIPSFSIDAGTLYAGHDRAWGDAKEKAFNANDYHNFSDNFDPTWDFSGDANLVRFGIDLGWQAITLPHTIEWLPGDEFEPARKASEAKPQSSEAKP
jgi:Zn-dependent M28 family amino/carboxypeptidase